MESYMMKIKKLGKLISSNFTTVLKSAICSQLNIVAEIFSYASLEHK